jgi:serine/threonine protein kinase
LKLENILLDKNENVKLVDFGFTREYEGKTNNLQTFCGTICYSAPEMLKGEKYAGEKVDVWSLGIILFALLTGELPWDDDDDLLTKHKILSSDPPYPESFPAEAKDLVSKLLAKRPILRPTLAEILAHPFLAAHAPAQQAILKLTRPPPFTTSLEKDTLQRMRSAGIDIDKVIEHVLAQRCDALAGWWALLIEKEERKEVRRERKRREKEQEAKSLRRISAASSRMTPTLQEVDEEHGEMQVSRGRKERRSFPTRKWCSRTASFALYTSTKNLPAQLVVQELPQLPEGTTVESPRSSTPPPPIEKDNARPSSTSRHRPPLPPKERDRRRSRGSTLQMVTSNHDLLMPPGAANNKRRHQKRHQNALLNQLASLKHWFVDSARRAKSPGLKSDHSSLRLPPSRSGQHQRNSTYTDPRNSSSAIPTLSSTSSRHNNNSSQTTPRQPRYSAHRASLSPAPQTPRSSVYRRSSAGLRGRKSTSSSVSSIRSVHHLPSHSKTSSTSSRSESIQSSALGAKPLPTIARSPHSSVKVLPATPTSSAFPSSIRVARSSPGPISISGYDERAYGGAMPSPGLVFAKRKKTPFRGPMLHISTHAQSRSRETSTSRRSGSVTRRKSVQTVAEEDEDEVEEVEVFSPVEPDAEATILDTPEEGTAAPINEHTA